MPFFPQRIKMFTVLGFETAKQPNSDMRQPDIDRKCDD
jgi:hypothetical protein